MEAEGRVEGVVVDEDAEEGEDVEHVELEAVSARRTEKSERRACAIAKSFVVCARLQWPSSCPKTATTSWGSLFSIKVS